MLTKLLQFPLLAVSCAGVACTALADDKPEWTKELTPAALGTFPKLDPIKLEYVASWKGLVDAGYLTFLFGAPATDGNKDYLAQAAGASTGLAKSLFDYKIYFHTKLDPVSLKPRSFHTTEIDEKAKVLYAASFNNSGVNCEETTYRFKQKSTQAAKKSFAFSPVLDVFSAMLQVRSMPLKDGDTIRLVIYPTDRPYLLNIQVVAHEWFQNQNAIKLKVSMQKIADNLVLLPYKKMTTTHMWLSDDKRRIPLEIRSEVFIGDVRVTLKNATPQ